MSTSFFNNSNYMSSHVSLDTRPSWGDDDVSSILDDNILDNNLDLDMSPVERRRESMMDSAIYSPSSRDWADFDHDMGASLDGPSPIASGSFEHTSTNNNPFIKLEAQQAFSSQHNGWNSRAMASGSVTPAYDGAFSASGHFDTSYLTAYATPAPTTYEASNITPNSIYQSSVSTLPSSASVSDGQWPTASVASSNDQESRPLTKRMRPQSPGPRSHSPLNLRRDGIRKKNARFDIPAERTLLNIDTLIAQSADDQEIKELKQQKRLLRNRQAA